MKGNIESFLKSGSVLALYLLFEIFLIAAFYLLMIRDKTY
jgi:hypothetical protein